MSLPARVTVILFAVGLAGCVAGTFAPPPIVSPSLVENARVDHADPQQLARGRALFVARCLECHTLPPAARHSPKEWPTIIARMARRASLTSTEQSTLTAYLRAAARSTPIQR